ncbi:hypothetical protein V2A60_002064 [Cordyceps javanica]|uniref:SET domain-containing protein n=1 Tax=Cordyceps javanica TaxID=43265 RepID=A0A545VH86_9HYPO|nr:SET domain-containing protein [Cordyceps javanica]TQW12208.1 SET domain protein [Cordyceps javanica]
METEIENLLAWAKTKGIEINGCAPKQLHGRGVGIVATRPLEANEIILRVPTDTLRSLANTPADVVARLPGASVHAILAAALCLDGDADLAAWRGVFPSRDDIRAMLPVCWPAELRALLPHTASALLAKQSAKFQKDWAAVDAAAFDTGGGGRLSKEAFLHAWLLVNTRSFYHTTRRTAKRPKEDHMVLQPVADLFNHSPAGWCAGAFDEAAFTITTRAAHAAGEELFIQYGPHGNDFLLVEYGFTLPPPLNDAWDETCLDPYLCPAAAAAGHRAALEDAGFWGGYMLDRQTACYRTHVALRALCLTPLQWRAVLAGERDEDRDKPAVDAALAALLRRQAETDVAARLRAVEEATAGEPLSRQSLRDRWAQIQELIVGTRRRLEEEQ